MTINKIITFGDSLSSSGLNIGVNNIITLDPDCHGSLPYDSLSGDLSYTMPSNGPTWPSYLNKTDLISIDYARCTYTTAQIADTEITAYLSNNPNTTTIPGTNTYIVFWAGSDNYATTTNLFNSMLFSLGLISESAAVNEAKTNILDSINIVTSNVLLRGEDLKAVVIPNFPSASSYPAATSYLYFITHDAYTQLLLDSPTAAYSLAALDWISENIWGMGFIATSFNQMLESVSNSLLTAHNKAMVDYVIPNLKTNAPTFILDMPKFYSAMEGDPATYGLSTQPLVPCYANGKAFVNHSCDNALFYDPVHLSSYGHSMVAEYLLDNLVNKKLIDADAIAYKPGLLIGDDIVGGYINKLVTVTAVVASPIHHDEL